MLRIFPSHRPPYGAWAVLRCAQVVGMEAGDSNLDITISTIASASGGSRESVMELIRKKQDEFSGLLTARGAAQLVAQELGIKNGGFAEPEDDASEAVPLADAADQCDVFVRVSAVFAPKAFEKNGRKGRVCNVSITDGKTKAALVLWNRDVDFVEQGKIERNDFLLLKNVQVKSAEPLELQSSMLTRIVVKKPDGLAEGLSMLAAPILPNDSVPVRKISEISEKDAEFDCYARILRIDDEREFVQKDGKKGRLATLLVSDGTANARMVLWDKNADVSKRAKVGDSIKAEGAYAKKSLSGDALEINVGWRGRALLHPYKHRLGDKGEVLRKMYSEKPLSQAAEGEEFISYGTVMSIDSAALVKKCKTCKATVRDGDKCEKCGDSRTRDLLVVSVTLDDGTKPMRAAFFDSQAKELLGVAYLSVEPNTIVELKREYLIGKKVKGVFAAKTNAFSGNLEVTARHVISID